MSLIAQDLSCRRGGRVLFDNLNFTLTAGAALILRGRNGAGKSSLLKICAGFLKPERGTLSWQGQEIYDDPELFRRSLAYIGHADAIKPALTVFENLQDWGRILDPAHLDYNDRIAAALDIFQISHLATTPVRYLSAGQKKRTALSRLLLRKSPLWLLDEASVSLDQDGVTCLGAALQAHREAGGMVMAATHLDLPIGEADLLTINQPILAEPVDTDTNW